MQYQSKKTEYSTKINKAKRKVGNSVDVQCISEKNAALVHWGLIKNHPLPHTSATKPEYDSLLCLSFRFRNYFLSHSLSALCSA